MARPKRDVIRYHATMPKAVYDLIELYLLDPIKGKPRYGAISKITTALWLQLLREIEKPGVQPVEVLRRYGVEIGELKND